MILVDTNLLIYAIDRDSPHHRKARRWLEDLLSGTTPVGLAWVVVLAFLRLTTRATVVRRPLTVAAALAYVDSWLAQPFVSLVVPGPGHWAILRALLYDAGTGGNLTSDAHLAALALESGAALHSSDADFARFPGIQHVNPLL